jgi:hypothetical protein
MATAGTTERDLRLDLFRGIALWLIFLDHIPSNAVSWITIRNYGFSDATEIYVFISGYTAAFVYGRAMREHGFLIGSARVLKRAWQIYIAHIFLFAIYLAEIGYVSQTFENPLYTEEMGILSFLQHPDVTVLQAMLLKFKPVNMDVLPLYIILLAGFAPVLWVLIRAPTMALGGSIVYLLFAFSIAMTWYIPRLAVYVPKIVADVIYPIDKTNLDVLRIAHFLSLAVIVLWLVPRDAQWLKSPICWPAIVCGQHSLETFCLSVFLSFAGHFIFTEISDRIWMQIAVSAAGIAIMVGTAWLLSWYKQVERRGRGPRPPAQMPSLAGGKA